MVREDFHRLRLVQRLRRLVGVQCSIGLHVGLQNLLITGGWLHLFIPGVERERLQGLSPKVGCRGASGADDGGGGCALLNTPDDNDEAERRGVGEGGV